MTLWIAGAIINVFGSILINGGTNVMKLGHNKRLALEEEEGCSVPPVRKIRAWQIGVGLFIAGNLLNFGSFAFAAQSILAALGSVQFIANVVFGRLILHEPITGHILIATALIVAGCCVIVSFGNHSSETFSSAELQSFYKADGYEAYLAVGTVAFVLAYGLYCRGNSLRKGKGQSMDQVPRVWQRLLPVAYSVFAALLGAQSVLFSKAISLLLRTTIQGDSQLGSWFFWVNVLLFMGAAAFWVTRLNMALRLFPAVVIVPTMQIAWTLVSIISGMVFYQEYTGMSALKSAMFAVGVALVFFGVWTLTTARNVSGELPYVGLEEELTGQRSPSTELADSEAADPSRRSVHSRQQENVQLGAGMEADSELNPLSPREVAAQEVATATARPAHHRRGSSIFRALTEDFSINFRQTGKQIGNVAAHPAPSFAYPMTAGAPAGKLVQKSKHSDLEMSAVPVAAAGGAGGVVPLRRAVSPIKVRADAAARGDNPFAGGSLTRGSEGSDASDGAHHAFGERGLLSDDDPMSPTWEDTGASQRISDYDGAISRGGAQRSTANAFLQALSPRHNPHQRAG